MRLHLLLLLLPALCLLLLLCLARLFNGLQHFRVCDLQGCNFRHKCANWLCGRVAGGFLCRVLCRLWLCLVWHLHNWLLGDNSSRLLLLWLFCRLCCSCWLLCILRLLRCRCSCCRGGLYLGGRVVWGHDHSCWLWLCLCLRCCWCGSCCLLLQGLAGSLSGGLRGRAVAGRMRISRVGWNLWGYSSR